MNLKLPLRVVHVVHRLDPGGLENLVMQMVLGADPGVVEPSVLCLSGIGELGQMYRDRVRITAVPAEPGYDRRAMAEMRRQIRLLRPAVVHSHDERPHLFATAGALSAGLPLPVRLNTVHLVYTDTSKKAILRRWTLAQATDVMVAVGERVRRNLIELDHIAPAKVRTILNGTALDVPRLERQQARRALGLPDDALVVGAVGRLAPVKDHRTLILAIARARVELPGLLAVIAGDGELGGELQRLVSEHGLDGAVRFAGYRPDVLSLLPAFDIFAQPSLSEGISLSLLEASAAGLPVVATGVDGNLETVRGEETGILTPVGDAEALARAIVRLGVSRELREGLGAAGRRYVTARFSFHRMTRDYEALYVELARRRGLLR